MGDERHSQDSELLDGKVGTAATGTHAYAAWSAFPGWILVTTRPTLDTGKQLLGCIGDLLYGAEDILQVSIWADHLASFGRDASDGCKTPAPIASA